MNLYLRMQTTTDVFTDKKDSGRGIITVSDKEVQARNEAEYHETLKGQLHGVHEFGMTGLQSETRYQ